MRFASAAAMLLAAALGASAQGAAPPDVLKDLAPTGKLRAAINFGNGVLAQKGPAGEPKGITPDQLRVVVQRAHQHGLTVTGHLDSGNRNSVNPRDAILMGIDRIEHFMGGDAFTADKSAYASYEHMTFDTPEFKRIAELYKQQHTYYDATLSAYGYYGKKDPDVFTYFVDEKKFLTPYMRSRLDARPPRQVNEQFENIYWNKRKEIKAFYDAGGRDLITLGTDHPSWGEFFTPFSVHRELLALDAQQERERRRLDPFDRPGGVMSFRAVPG